MSDKKKMQLGMNPSTASGRLIKDTLWKLVVMTGQDKCFQCSEVMTRDTFSVEHKEPWLDSEDPVGLFFDQDNISFSHHSCNVAASRRGKYTPEEAVQVRLKAAREWKAANRTYDPVERKERYQRIGT